MLAIAMIAGLVASAPTPGGPVADRSSPTFDETVPEALVSPTALEHRELGRMLFQALPADQKLAVEAAGGIGPQSMTPLGVGVLNAFSPSGQMAKAQHRLGDLYKELSPSQVRFIERLAAQAAAGEEVPAFCLAPDTDPKVAAAMLLAIEAIVGDGLRYNLGDRWTSTSTDGAVAMGKTITLTYSYAPDGTTVDGSPSSLFAWLNAVYAGNGGQAEWQGRVDQIFNRWGSLTGVSYIFEPNDDGGTFSSSRPGIAGVRGDCRIGAIPIDGGGGVLAYNYFPNYGEMVLDSGDSFYNNLTQNSRRFRNIVAHEHGHGMGISHVCPTSGTKLMEPFINTGFNGPQDDDILAGQRNYGDDMEDNDTAGVAAPLGSLTEVAPFAFTRLSIDDNSDVDYYEFDVAAAGDVTVTLTPGPGDYLSGTQNGDGSCSPGVLIAYTSMHDLSFELRDSGDVLVGAVNNALEGAVETGTVAAPSAGTYYLVVRGDATNNIQDYEMDVSFLEAVVNCPADLNGDGILDNADIAEFITLFFAGDLAVDLNGDGILDNADIAAFITLFLAGC